MHREQTSQKYSIITIVVCTNKGYSDTQKRYSVVNAKQIQIKEIHNF